jgi:hypothetical protein
MVSTDFFVFNVLIQNLRMLAAGATVSVCLRAFGSAEQVSKAELLVVCAHSCRLLEW